MTKRSRHTDFLAGLVTSVTPNTVTWQWACDADRTATRRTSTLRSQQIRPLSLFQINIIVNEDFAYTLADVNGLQEQRGDNQPSSQPQFSPPEYS